jgi:hypothetical protein
MRSSAAVIRAHACLTVLCPDASPGCVQTDEGRSQQLETVVSACCPCVHVVWCDRAVQDFFLYRQSRLEPCQQVLHWQARRNADRVYVGTTLKTLFRSLLVLSRAIMQRCQLSHQGGATPLVHLLVHLMSSQKTPSCSAQHG